MNANNEVQVGIVGYGLYVPEPRMTAEQISEANQLLESLKS